MKTSFIALLSALLLGGCGVGYQASYSGESAYMYGSYGWVVYEYESSYGYDYHYSDTLYFETPYLERGCEVYVDIYNDYNYALLGGDLNAMSLYDSWFSGSDAHYSYVVNRSGVQQFYMDYLHRDAVVNVHYSCGY